MSDLKFSENTSNVINGLIRIADDTERFEIQLRSHFQLLTPLDQLLETSDSFCKTPSNVSLQLLVPTTSTKQPTAGFTERPALPLFRGRVFSSSWNIVLDFIRSLFRTLGCFRGPVTANEICWLLSAEVVLIRRCSVHMSCSRVERMNFMKLYHRDCKEK